MLEKILAAAALFIFVAFSVFCLMPGSFADIELHTILSESLHTPLNTFLQQHPFITIIAGVVFAALVIMLPKPLKWVFLVLYVIFIIYMTLLFRPAGESRGMFELFWSYKKMFTSSYYRQEVLQNIWLFVPLGAALFAIFRRRWVLILPLVFSILIEMIQYFFGIGLAELDDILSNTLGGALGTYAALLILGTRKQRSA